MARKKHYITNINNRDIKALNFLWCTGYVKREHLLSCITKSRISNYEKEGLIIKDIHVTTSNEKIIAYKFSKKGSELARNFLNRDSFYKSQSIIHDCKLSDRYFSLTEKERESWQTENELRDRFFQKLEGIKIEDNQRYNELYNQYQNREISMPDCSYQAETGIEVFYESVTNSYKQIDLIAKERAVEVIKVNNSSIYETVR